MLFDCDAQALYYRKDVFTNADNQAKFKAKYGYDLPAPPMTTKELHDCADFFTGWDWNGDGNKGWGLALHAKVNEQGFFHFLSLSAPYVDLAGQQVLLLRSGHEAADQLRRASPRA